ncbi:MAG: histidinol-phosphatase HisJ family protein [Brevinematales bacterium]|nr:histidinol-phosphatase HisJ family protein [Brevinematales bacterium]
MLADSHIHSFFSPDSSSSIEEIAITAQKKGLDFFTIADHYQVWEDKEYTFDVESRCLFLTNKQKQFPGLLIGVEIGEIQNNPSLLQQWKDLPFDLFLGSIHVAGKVFGPFATHNVPDETVYEAYFSEVRRMVETTDIDAVAHMDFPRRYLASYHIPWDMVDSILSLIIEKDIALEINTSLWRKGLPFSMPDIHILTRYAQKGGKKVILGSDAHRPEEVGEGIEKALILARELSLTPGYYKKHVFHPLEVL